VDAGNNLRCGVCGFTQADFKKVGRLGCGECYRTFAEPLRGLLKTMHKGGRHVGKVPQAVRQNQDSAEQLKALQKRLDKAVAAEDFEAAAALRDEIKQLKERGSELRST
jgi:protein arginine kinase activator